MITECCCGCGPPAESTAALGRIMETSETRASLVVLPRAQRRGKRGLGVHVWKVEYWRRSVNDECLGRGLQGGGARKRGRTRKCDFGLEAGRSATRNSVTVCVSARCSTSPLLPLLSKEFLFLLCVCTCNTDVVRETNWRGSKVHGSLCEYTGGARTGSYTSCAFLFVNALHKHNEAMV